MLAFALALALGQLQPQPGPRRSKPLTRLVFKTVELKKGPSDAFDQFVRGREGALLACYERELQKDGSQQGTVIADFDVVKGGVATDLRVSHGLLSPEIADCVAAQVRSWRFPFEPADVYPARISFNLTSEERSEFDDILGVAPGPMVKTDAVVRGQLNVKTLEVDGKTNEEVSRFVKARLRALQGCYEKELKRVPTLKGTVTIDATINTNGRSADVNASDDLGIDEVSACSKAIVRGWTWPFKPDAPQKLKLVFTVKPNG
jgi:hypothetical protein